MLVLRGPLAHSHFRMESWLSHINHHVPQVTTLASEYVHFLDLESDLNDTEHNILSNFLNYGSLLTDFKVDHFNGLQVVVVPKFSCQSSWSSKATHLVQLCQLNKVKKLERGIIYYIGLSEEVSKSEAEIIANFLHDPLTELVFYDLETAENILKDNYLNNNKNKNENKNNINQEEKFQSANVQNLNNPYLNKENKWALTVHSFELLNDKINLSMYHFPNLNIPGFEQPWELEYNEKNNDLKKGARENESIKKVTALQALMELPIETARFCHEAGFLNLCGYLRTYVYNSYLEPLSLNEIQLEEAFFRLLYFPVIADKSYMNTVHDRFLTGKVVRDALIGPWQVAVSDYHLMLLDKELESYRGVAISLGERSPLAYLNPEASIRMSIGEAITRIAGVDIVDLSEIKLKLYVQYIEEIKAEENKIETLNKPEPLNKIKTLNKIETLKSTSETFGKYLGVKVDLQFEAATKWNIAAVAESTCLDVRRCVSSMLIQDADPSFLIFVDLSDGHQRMAESCLAQVFNKKGEFVPDFNNAELLTNFFKIIQKLKLDGKILAYHARSNGGLWITLCEMAFAGHVGIEVDVSELGRNIKSILFNEELGAVIQVRGKDVESVLNHLTEAGVPNSYLIGTLDNSGKVTVIFNEEPVCSYDRIVLQKAWSETSYHIEKLRSNPRCARKEYEQLDDEGDPGIQTTLAFNPINESIEKDIGFYINKSKKPLVAVLVEEGVSCYKEIVSAFEAAAFDCKLIQMNNLCANQESLDRFKGLAVCGGFSFGDVLGAGKGWAKRILFQPHLKDEFEKFFNRLDTFAVGISNGCQMLSSLRTLIPGTQYWPNFIQNHSERFESRWCLVEVQETNSPFFKEMAGSRLAVPISHQEGRAEFENEEFQDEAIKKGLVVLRYVDNYGRKTTIYPPNPNGSPLGITGLTSENGRVLIMMPHPERALRSIQYPDCRTECGNLSPWLRIFQNIRGWVGK